LSLADVRQCYGKKELTVHSVWDKEHDIRSCFG
jgi:hypothetical protein